VDHVILIAPGGASGPVRGLADRLVSIGVTITVVEEIAAAAEASARERRPPAVMLDLRDAGEGGDVDGDEALRKVSDALRRTLEALPHALPIVLVTALSYSYFRRTA